MSHADLALAFAYDMKDAKWRWLADAGYDAEAGEERKFSDAIEKARLAGERLLRQ